MNDWMTQSVTKFDSKIQLTCEELIRQIIHISRGNLHQCTKLNPAHARQKNKTLI